MPITVRERRRPACAAPPAVTAVPGAAGVILIACGDFLPLTGDGLRPARVPLRGRGPSTRTGIIYFAGLNAGTDPFTVTATNDVGETTLSVLVTVGAAASGRNG